MKNTSIFLLCLLICAQVRAVTSPGPDCRAMQKLSLGWEKPFFPFHFSKPYEERAIAHHRSHVDGNFLNRLPDAPVRAEGDFVAMLNQRLPWDGYNQDGMGIERQSRVVVSTLITRFSGDGTSLPEFFAQVPSAQIHRREFAVTAVHNALADLYGQYASQGPERVNVIETCRAEDRAKAHRTIHFLTSSAGDFFSHLQVLTSKGPGETLNVEDHFGPIERKAGETWVELGRLRIDPDIQPSGQAEMKDISFKPLARLKTWQQAYSYLNHDVKPQGVAMQVNTRVLKVLESQKLLVFDKRRVSSSYAEEWVLTQTPEQRLRTEENLVREELIWNLKKFESGSFHDFYWRPNRNERDVLVRLGLIYPIGGVATEGDVFYRQKEEGTTEGALPRVLVPEETFYRVPDVAIIWDRIYAEKLLKFLESRNTR